MAQLTVLYGLFANLQSTCNAAKKYANRKRL